MRGQQNGLEGLRKISPAEVKEYEPYVACVEGMWVPQTGIVDYKVVCEKYAEKLRQAGTDIRFGEKVTGITKGNSLSIVQTEKNTYDTLPLSCLHSAVFLINSCSQLVSSTDFIKISNLLFLIAIFKINLLVFP